ncbi:MAG: hypothetical protein ACQERW_10220 [Cyanobacteriota bacterium]
MGFQSMGFQSQEFQSMVGQTRAELRRSPRLSASLTDYFPRNQPVRSPHRVKTVLT